MSFYFLPQAEYLFCLFIYLVIRSNSVRTILSAVSEKENSCLFFSRNGKAYFIFRYVYDKIKNYNNNNNNKGNSGLRRICVKYLHLPPLENRVVWKIQYIEA